jgi:hypothetical protein
MPSSRSWALERLKRASQEGILEACLERSRPMRVRKVVASGTKGVGEGICERAVELFGEAWAARRIGLLVIEKIGEVE